MPRGSDNQARLNLRIHQPEFAASLHILNRHSLEDARATPRQQKCVELAAPDSITDRPAVVRLDFRPANAAGPETSDWLQDAAAAVCLQINLEFFDNRRSDPSTANFVTRKNGAIEDRDIQSRTAQTPGARRARGSAADNQDIARIHLGSFSAAASCWS